MSSTAERSGDSSSPWFFRLATQVAAEVSAASIVTPEAVEASRGEPRNSLARSLPDLPELLPTHAEPFGRPVVSRRRLPDELRHPNAVRQGPWVRLPGPLAVLVVLFGIFATGLGVESVTTARVLPGWMSSGGSRPPANQVTALAAGQPVGITIPSLNVRAVVNEVGLASDGTIDVPPLDRAQEAGWYDQSPTPGEVGPSVIVGHVDTRSGPAVFHQLSRMKPGDNVEVAREDRTVAVFQVERLERFDKAHLPADQVYGDFTKPNLRLITCGGRWVGGQTGYADNVVVFANLVRAKRT
ncbi:MAG TPA: class F sortase [Micromonosporaceae bacterium]|nr:class F sortase [Micromonosporaceae bacterium]